MLSAAAIAAALTTRWLGRTLEYYPELGSTNVRLAELAAAGAPAGTLVITDHQTAGRGRLGRRWEAPPGSGLLFSLLYRPDWPAERAIWLTMITALAGRDVLKKHTGAPIYLKWPNDLLGGPPPHAKLAGILMESALIDDRVDWLIVGMGLNVNLSADQLPVAASPPTSLQLLAGRPLDRLALLVDLLAALERGFAAAEQGVSPLAEWSAALINKGRRVMVHPAGGEPWRGIACGTDEWGRLLVERSDGTVQAVAAADVSLRPLA
ncbi:MAG: biotin--[acetyl-CoA-carboxylase] ligase [Anaerolineales bacterium]|nr:biotin--[acetyl-CoA-carboxylase] ligase [Anaerolineales bacterium]